MKTALPLADPADKVVTFALSEDELYGLDSIAMAQNRTRSCVLRHLVRVAIVNRVAMKDGFHRLMPLEMDELAVMAVAVGALPNLLGSGVSPLTE